jgi:hypothetical protein
MKAVLRVLRALLRLPPPKISRDKAIELALAELARRGSVPLQADPVQQRGPLTREGLRDWTVLIDPAFRPCRRVVIDNQTGKVLKFLHLSR